MITLTRPDGSKIEFSAIASIRPAVASLYAPGVRSVVREDGQDQGVIESVAEIKAMVEANR